jgi:predicted nucleotidyltransferase component of viral defense system
MARDIAASVRQKLRNLARERQEDFDYVLRQFVMQRLLYRLSQSKHVDQFLLKGALLFWVWNEDFHRPTRDIDLLTIGNNDVTHLVDVFRQVVSLENQDDGLVFDVESVNGIEIKEDSDYTGVRLTGFGNLAKARIPFQIDIGYGDIVIPAAVEALLPSFLDLPSPKLKIYPVYGVIAEKFQAMVYLGLANSRMKDFYDICVIAHTMDLDGELLSQAVKATFERRKTLVVIKPLYLFGQDFTQDKSKHAQWNAFKNKNTLNIKTDFAETVYEIQNLLEPVYQSIALQKIFVLKWLSDEFKWKEF